MSFFECIDGQKLFFTVLDEAIRSQDVNLIETLMQKKSFQALYSFGNMVPRLMQQLSNAADFYVEMKVDFSSWGK